jgi:mannose-1-phosphate guanylyltransferase
VGIHTESCVVVSEPGQLIATIGVTDLLIIQDGDCTLVAHRSRESEVKQIVDELRKRRQEEYL